MNNKLKKVQVGPERTNNLFTHRIIMVTILSKNNIINTFLDKKKKFRYFTKLCKIQ